MIQREIIGDREEPRRKFGPRLVTFARSIDPQENFLREILRFLRASHKMDDYADQPMLVTFHQRLEGPLHVVAHLKHQTNVRVLRLELLFQWLGGHEESSLLLD